MYLESRENGEWAYPCMTALVWARCAWAQLLFLAALPRTAALQCLTGNPWCWSAAGWPPDQGALTPRPVPRDECLPLGYTEPREFLHTSPDSGAFQGTGGNPGCASQLREQTVGGLLQCEVGEGVPLTWLPVWKSRIYSPLVYLSSLRWRLSKASAWRD